MIDIKFDWHPNTTDLTWWHAHGKAISSFCKADQRRIRKYIFSWLPTCERSITQRKQIVHHVLKKLKIIATYYYDHVITVA
jgi:hypothetical protein